MLYFTLIGTRAMFCCERMSKLACLLFVTLLCAFATAQQAGHMLNNDDIVKMTRDGFEEGVIVALIESNNTDFDVSINGLNALKSAGVTSKVMETMLKAEAKKRQASANAQTQPSQPARQNPPSSVTVIPDPAMSAMGGGTYAQQAMALAMSSGAMGGAMPGMLDTRQLPPLTWINGAARQLVKPSIAQIANTQTKGNGMPGAGSQATGMLMGLGRQALSFGAIGGGMFAGPGASMAMGMMGGLGGMTHHQGVPKVTYVWALPGQQSGLVIPNTKPRFEMSYGNLLGIDPDAYEPQLVKLVQSKDNWRLVGATKTTMGQIGTEAYEKVTEARIAVKAEKLGRGQVQIEPKQPLGPGEYAIVLRAIHPGKRSAGSLGGGAETSLFFSVWDFSVRNDAGVVKP
jgi:hypothetical protein